MMKVARILHEMPAVPGFGDAGKTTPYKDDPTNLKWGTLPETNISPENRPPQYESSIPTIHF